MCSQVGGSFLASPSRLPALPPSHQPVSCAVQRTNSSSGSSVWDHVSGREIISKDSRRRLHALRPRARGCAERDRCCFFSNAHSFHFSGNLPQQTQGGPEAISSATGRDPRGSAEARTPFARPASSPFPVSVSVAVSPSWSPFLSSVTLP